MPPSAVQSRRLAALKCRPPPCVFDRPPVWMRQSPLCRRRDVSVNPETRIRSGQRRADPVPRARGDGRSRVVWSCGASRHHHLPARSASTLPPCPWWTDSGRRQRGRKPARQRPSTESGSTTAGRKRRKSGLNARSMSHCSTPPTCVPAGGSSPRCPARVVDALLEGVLVIGASQHLRSARVHLTGQQRFHRSGSTSRPPRSSQVRALQPTCCHGPPDPADATPLSPLFSGMPTSPLPSTTAWVDSSNTGCGVFCT